MSPEPEASHPAQVEAVRPKPWLLGIFVCVDHGWITDDDGTTNYDAVSVIRSEGDGNVTVSLAYDLIPIPHSAVPGSMTLQGTHSAAELVLEPDREALEVERPWTRAYTGDGGWQLERGRYAVQISEDWIRIDGHVFRRLEPAAVEAANALTQLAQSFAWWVSEQRGSARAYKVLRDRLGAPRAADIPRDLPVAGMLYTMIHATAGEPTVPEAWVAEHEVKFSWERGRSMPFLLYCRASSDGLPLAVRGALSSSNRRP